MAKKYIDADLLKKEINKHYDDYRAKFHQNGERYYLGLIDGIEMTKRIIDSLQQEQSCDTCTNDKGCVTCKDGGLWEGKEQPSEDLEAEVDRYVREQWDMLTSTDSTKSIVRRIARHFTNWQKEQMGEQVEKDLALTIDDLEAIHTFLYVVKNNKTGCFTFTRLSDEQYEEVLKRFNRYKEEQK